jgi:proteasome lid subunit RPN8/RPN11
MTVTNAIVASIQQQMTSSGGVEICGAMIGDNGDVVEIMPLINNSMRPKHAYLISASDVLRAEKQAQSKNAQLIGFYHSHPDGASRPSPADVEQALPGYIYLILSAQDGARAWRLRDDRSGFDEVSGFTGGNG